MEPTYTLSLSVTALGEVLDVPHLTATLVHPDGTLRSRRLGLTGLLVGQGPDCQLTTSDPSVSREHCRLALTPRGVAFRDLGSKNGSYLRGLAVTEVLLPRDSTVMVGQSQLTVRQSGPSEQLPVSADHRFGRALGRSASMRALFQALEQLARSDARFLLAGESGTGKTLLAQAVHERSARKAAPFIVFDCASASAPLLESELFGHAAGAFTGADSEREGLIEVADGGTLFLDEVAELPLEAQTKLLRVLDDGRVKRVGENTWRSVDVRIISATHRDLEHAIAVGRIRSDLYIRLAPLNALVPPLRDRREDIPLLVEAFLSQHHPPRALEDLPANALELFASHPWPGNVRELRNSVLRWVLFPELAASAGFVTGTETRSLDRGLLQLPLREARDAVVAQFEHDYLTAKLQAHGGDVGFAAEEMGVSRQLVYRLMERHGVSRG